MSDTAADGTVQTRRAPHGRPGFSLVELLFVILLIFLLMGLLLGAIHFVTKQARGVVDGATVNALKSSVSQFTQAFNFPPPLVKDGYATGFTQGPLSPLGPGQKPLVYSLAVSPAPAPERTFLRTAAVGGANPQADLRFSLYSMSYYVMGVLDIDGVAGPGFRTPKRDGSFESAGRIFSPFFDLKGHPNAIVEAIPATGRFELRDTHGVAIRYYRWVHGDANGQVSSLWNLNVPWILGATPMDQDPLQPTKITIKDEYRNADWAIVAAGPDGLFGDEFLLGPPNAVAGHPQYMSPSDFQIKLGVPSSMTLQDQIAKAMSDNVVVVGVEVNR